MALRSSIASGEVLIACLAIFAFLAFLATFAYVTRTRDPYISLLIMLKKLIMLSMCRTLITSSAFDDLKRPRERPDHDLFGAGLGRTGADRNLLTIQ